MKMVNTQKLRDAVAHAFNEGETLEDIIQFVTEVYDQFDRVRTDDKTAELQAELQRHLNSVPDRRLSIRRVNELELQQGERAPWVICDNDNPFDRGNLQELAKRWLPKPSKPN